MDAERWETMADLVAARERFAAAIPGWAWPYAAGLAVVRPATVPGGPEDVRFPVVNTAQHRLPVVVLAGVLGNAGGSATYEVDRALLALAVERLSPAAAATSVAHPNLEAWKQVLATLTAEPAARAVAVFVAEPADPITSEYDAQLRSYVPADA